MGVTLETPEEKFYFGMYLFFKNGIPPSVYRKEASSDARMMEDLDSAVSGREIGNANIMEMINKMRR